MHYTNQTKRAIGKYGWREKKKTSSLWLLSSPLTQISGGHTAENGITEEIEDEGPILCTLATIVFTQARQHLSTFLYFGFFHLAYFIPPYFFNLFESSNCI